MKHYWDSLSQQERSQLAKRVGSSAGYLRLVFTGHKKAGFTLAQKLEEETAGAVTRSELRPDIYPGSDSIRPAP
ncbi:YdaS family helix-turn-helix protein [uncultured Pantoea sp.]|uniref:transcriptional regulator n=1 Tax=uncultured Pantoea sp. TaxID=218084 RepID=UPI0025EAB20B|nr:YdaS family helix-turn-helix protein [uncultured Pantoea sp.]